MTDPVTVTYIEPKLYHKLTMFGRVAGRRNVAAQILADIVWPDIVGLLTPDEIDSLTAARTLSYDTEDTQPFKDAMAPVLARLKPPLDKKTIEFNEGETSLPVVFDLPMPNADYIPRLFVHPGEGTPDLVLAWPTNIGEEGFTIELSGDPGEGNSVKVRWEVIAAR